MLQNAEQTDFSATEILVSTEENLKNYNAHIVRCLSSRTPNSSDVLEFGAGIGTLAQIWREQTGVAPRCLEIDEAQRAVVIEKGFPCYRSVGEINSTYDVVYTSNVLEHIEDDVQALRDIHRLLKPGGTLSIWVPAMQILYSSFDAAVGHYRRYERAELASKVKAAGFEIEKLTYADSVGFFASLFFKLKNSSYDLRPASQRSLWFYDRIVLPLTKLSDWIGFRFLFGKNLLLIARKPLEQ